MAAKADDRVVWIRRGWQPIAVGFCPSRAAWDRVARRYNIADDYPEAADKGGHTALMVNDKSGEAIILVTIYAGAERDAHELILTIVHEAVHVWQFICAHIGERDAGIEMEAYGIEEISRGLIDAYCRTRGKGKVWE